MTAPNINAPKFFVDHKKGEVVELMNLLKNPTIDKDPKKKKDIIKRVIAYMTLGVDVSKLFHEIVKASYINDIVTKKMVFLYIVNYADESDSAILAINTFLKDIKNENPKIRGLALRSLCSLKFKGAYEYFANALYESLKDPHHYVRKTAVMALLKVYHLNPSLITDKDIETLYEMIKDKDPIVVTNTLNVLNEILSKDGGIAISGKMVNYLLNIIQDFNEWGQNMILNLVAKYKPKDESQMFDILNTLEDKYFLKHSCAAIVLATTKVFINFTKEMKIYDQVLKRVRDPLVTLMTSSEVAGNHEMSYVILSHMFIIIQKGGRSLFSEYYKKFYVHFDEPFYIKKLKLEIMVEISNESNYSDILNEMEEYVYDVNAKFSMHTLRSIGNVALNIDSSVLSVVNILKAFLGRNVDYIVSETMIVLKSI